MLSVTKNSACITKSLQIHVYSCFLWLDTPLSIILYRYKFQTHIPGKAFTGMWLSSPTTALPIHRLMKQWSEEQVFTLTLMFTRMYITSHNTYELDHVCSPSPPLIIITLNTNVLACFVWELSLQQSLPVIYMNSEQYLVTVTPLPEMCTTE